MGWPADGRWLGGLRLRQTTRRSDASQIHSRRIWLSRWCNQYRCSDSCSFRRLTSSVYTVSSSCTTETLLLDLLYSVLLDLLYSFYVRLVSRGSDGWFGVFHYSRKLRLDWSFCLRFGGWWVASTLTLYFFVVLTFSCRFHSSRGPLLFASLVTPYCFIWTHFDTFQN